METKESLTKKINYWKETLKKCNDPVESAVLVDKISNARLQLQELNLNKKEKVIKSQIDAPMMIDKDISSNHQTNVSLSRGQIMNCGEAVFGMII